MIHLFALFALSSRLVSPVRSHPVDWIHRINNAREDGSWLWGWAWASDGTVSVVDKSPPVTFAARPASFGAELVDPLLGYVIPLSAFTAPCTLDPTLNMSHRAAPGAVYGCPDLCVVGPHEPDPTESWIALVQRGGCPFVEKARQAQKLGAKAVVVGGNSDSPDALLNMYSERESPDVTIAATFIKYWDYVELLSMISTSNTTHAGLNTLSLLISTEYSAWEWYSPIVTFIVILLLPSLLTFITLLIHRVRAARAAQRDRAPEEVVHNLPWRVWTGTGREKDDLVFPPVQNLPTSGPDLEQGLGGVDEPASCPSTSHDIVVLPPWVDQQVECAICLDSFVQGDRVRVLPCYHMFHMDEIDEWLIHKKKLCPVCKMDVTCPHPPPSNASHPPNPHAPMADAPPRAASAASERTPLLQDHVVVDYETAS